MSKKYLFLAIIVLIAGAGFLTVSRTFQHAAPPRPLLIGILARGASYTPGVEGFRKKMKELGYEEGKNVRYDVTFFEKKEDLPPVISRLLKEHVDLIHTYSTPPTVEAYRQTKTVPIVFGSMGDPLLSKTIQSIQSSGTNVTGVNSLSSPLAAKRLEFLVEAVPSIRKVAIPFTSDDIAGRSSYNTALDIAQKLKINLVPYYISPERPARDTAKAILRKDVDAIMISSDAAVWANLDAYVAQAKKEKLPFAVFDKDMVVKGGLLGYGPDYAVTGAQAAVLADKILHGEKPTDLPIETPGRFILAVNLNTAADIGIRLPNTFLEKADLIIQSK